MDETNDPAAAILALLPPIFRDATDPEVDARFFLGYPQQVGEHIYATDGRICVRVPATPERTAALPPLPEGKRFVKPESLAAVFGSRSAWHDEPTPLPSLDGFEKCGVCGGSGRLPERKCRGCDRDWNDEEQGCGGRGIIPAGECDGCEGTTFKDPRSRYVDFREDVWLSLLYVAALVRHGATMYLPVATNTAKTLTPVYFTAGEAEGRLMPMLTEAMQEQEASRAEKVRA